MFGRLLQRLRWEKVPRRMRYIALVAFLFIVGWLGLTLIINPQRQVRAKLQTEVDRLWGEVEALRVQVMEVSAKTQGEERVRQSLEATREKLLRALARLPEGRELSTFLRELTDPQGEGGIEFLSITPRPLENRGEFLELPFTIEMEASFRTLGHYLARLEKLERVVVVKNIVLRTGSSKKSRLHVSISAATYVMGGEQ